MDIRTWLRDLGLERYAAAIRDNEVDWTALPKLTAWGLEDLGVVLRSRSHAPIAGPASRRSGPSP